MTNVPEDVREYIDNSLNDDMEDADFENDRDKMARLLWLKRHWRRYLSEAKQQSTQEAMKRIRVIIDKACDDALNMDDFSDEAINWGDLGCVSVSVDIDGSYYASIEEASPTCRKFPQYVYDKLYESGFSRVEVRTEW